LSVLNKLGVSEIKGFDGAWVDKKTLKISQDCFTVTELDKSVPVDKKYDLAISLEVAEHLPKESAALFVDSLTNASDIILFSAAIPFQGGVNHINEQWPEYWDRLFREKEYIAVDFLRRKIWNEKGIAPWYRQNVMIFCKKERLYEIKVPENDYCLNKPPVSMVLPELYENKISGYERIIEKNHITVSLKILYKTGIKRTVKKLVGERIWGLIKAAKTKLRKYKSIENNGE
jgi:hypothetical protein